MAGGWLWLGNLRILGGNCLLILRHRLLGRNGFWQRGKKKRERNESEETGVARGLNGMAHGPGKRQMGLGFHALLCEPDGSPRTHWAFRAAARHVLNVAEVRAISVDPELAG